MGRAAAHFRGHFQHGRLRHTLSGNSRAPAPERAGSPGDPSMPSLTEWRVPSANQPRAGDYAFDLDKVLSSVVGLHSIVPADAHSAETLGTERAGNGVVIDDGLVLTIGY